MNTPRVAIVHDWMLLGGAEKVVEQLLLMYPDAPLYTSCISPLWQQKLKNRRVITGYLNWAVFKKLRKFLPILRQKWFEKLDFTGYDIVISSSGAEAKGIKVPKGVLHINYCHAPTHYYWSRYNEYIHNPGFGAFNPLAKLGLKLFLRPMRKWDYKAAQRPHVIVANSTHIATEVAKYYNRQASAVYPPVSTARFTKSTATARSGYVIAGRQTPYKRFDIAITAATQLKLPLTVLGYGPDHKRLKSMAGPTVTFKTGVTDTDMATEFHNAKAFIFAGLDDFGITPVEAMAAGCPVIAFKAGGALDYVLPGVTGVFFTEQTTQSLKDAIIKMGSLTFNEQTIAKSTAQFSPKNFKLNMGTLVANEYSQFTK